MQACGGAGSFRVLSGNGLKNGAMLDLDLLRHAFLSGFDGAGGLCGCSQEVEEKLDQRKKMRVAGGIGNTAVESNIGVNAIAYAAGMGASTLLIGSLTARWRADRLIIASLAICSLCLATFAASTSFAVWGIARFLLGFFAKPSILVI